MRGQKGITLVALIITIIVLLILAVVAIASIQNDGIINHSKNTANLYNAVAENEANMVNHYENYLNNFVTDITE